MAAFPVFNLAGSSAVSATAATVAWPTHATGHVALLLVQTDNQTVTLTTSAGFVEVTNSPQAVGTASAASAVALAVYWCRATSASQPSPVVGATGDHVAAQIITFTNVIASGNPWDITSGGTKGTSSTNAQISTATTTTANCLIVAVLAHGADSATAQCSTFTNANLTSLAKNSDFSTTTGNGGGIGTAAGKLAVAGAVGITTVTLATASKNAFMQIALKGPLPITGSGGVTVSPTLSGTGIRGAIGTAALAVALTLAATGQATQTGSGGVSLAPSVSGTGQVISNIGSGNVSVSPSLSGTGKQTETGSGGVSVGFTLVGTGRQTETGSGSVPISPSLAGTGRSTQTGSGGVTISPSLSGTGRSTQTGSGGVSVSPVLGTITTTTWNPSDKSSGTSLSGGNLTANTDFGSVRAALGKSSGRWYWEMTPGSPAETDVAIALASHPLANYPGQDTSSWVYFGVDGNKWTNDTPVAYGSTFTTGDVIGCALDMDAGKVWWSKNGVWQGGGDPAAGTGAAFSGLSGTIYPCTGGASGVITANFGASAFAYSPPSGFAVLGEYGNPGVVTETGSGSVAVSPSLSGSGKSTQSGSGNVNVSPTVSGSGQATQSGSGAVSVSPSILGAGQATQTGTGSVAVPIRLAGSGQSTQTGSGSVSITPSVSGVGTWGSGFFGPGAVSFAPALSSVGSVQSQTLGNGSVGVVLTLDATGGQTQSGSGVVEIAVSLSGTGSVSAGEITGSGNVDVSLSISGTGTRNIPLHDGKYPSEHAAALDALENATGFSDAHDSAVEGISGARGFSAEHSSALKDLGEAGK